MTEILLFWMFFGYLVYRFIRRDIQARRRQAHDTEVARREGLCDSSEIYLKFTTNVWGIRDGQ